MPQNSGSERGSSYFAEAISQLCDDQGAQTNLQAGRRHLKIYSMSLLRRLAGMGPLVQKLILGESTLALSDMVHDHLHGVPHALLTLVPSLDDVYARLKQIIIITVNGYSSGHLGANAQVRACRVAFCCLAKYSYLTWTMGQQVMEQHAGAHNWDAADRVPRTALFGLCWSAYRVILAMLDRVFFRGKDVTM